MHRRRSRRVKRDRLAKLTPYTPVESWPVCPRVLIVASGPSLSFLRRNRAPLRAPGVTVIAVNGAVEWVPRADYFCSIDPSKVNLARFETLRPNVQYVVACPEYYLLQPAIIHLRRVEREDVTEFTRLNSALRGVTGLSEDPGALHTGNSAYAALGLAYLMKAERVALLGVDGTQEERIEGGAPNDLEHLPRLFESAKPQLDAAGITVLNGSPDSRVTCFKRVAPAECLEWITP